MEVKCKFYHFFFSYDQTTNKSYSLACLYLWAKPQEKNMHADTQVNISICIYINAYVYNELILAVCE